MSTGVCYKCGKMKAEKRIDRNSRAFSQCPACGDLPETDAELAKSLALTNQYYTFDELREISAGISKGVEITIPPDTWQRLTEHIEKSRPLPPSHTATSSFQVSCNHCKQAFSVPYIPDMSLEPILSCPDCGEETEVSITAICMHCGQRTPANGESVGHALNCMSCGREFVCNTLEGRNGEEIVVRPTGKTEMEDISAMLASDKRYIQSQEKNQSFSQENTSKPGCLGGIVFAVLILIGVIAGCSIL